MATMDTIESRSEATLQRELGTAFMRHRPLERCLGEPATTGLPQIPEPPGLARRIRSAYRSAIATETGTPDSIWTYEFAAAKSAVHEILIGNDDAALSTLLSCPGQSTLFMGFESLYAGNPHTKIPGWGDWLAQFAFDNLTRLAEAVGAIPLENPEQVLGGGAKASLDTETVLSKLDETLGFHVDFPNPFPGEQGTTSSRGIISDRAIQALYQAARIAQLTHGIRSPHILEIGAGLGRTAYYCHRMGLQNYTIVDLPMTGVAQANFLGRALGPEAVRLHGEPRNLRARAIHIIPPHDFFRSWRRYSIVLNADSLTEMSRETAQRYFVAVSRRAPLLLSINHEANLFRVRDLCRGRSAPDRQPYWMRRGYVEEIIRFPWLRRLLLSPK